MRTILLYLFAAVAAVVAYQAVSFLNRYFKTRSREALWCFSFALISALYALSFIPLYTIEGPAMSVAIRLVMLAGFFALGLYLKCMMLYFGTTSRLLSIGVGVILTIAMLYGCLAVYDLATGSHLLVAPKAQPVDIRSALLPVYFVSHYDMLALTRYPHATCRLIALASLLFLLIRGNLKRDRLVQIGVIVSVACLVHNMVTVNWAVDYFAPLLPFMNLIEITRLEWRARRGDQLRLESYEEQVASFEQGLNQHLKLKRIGLEAAAFLHDAKNLAFTSDCKLSLIQMQAEQDQDPELVEHIKAARASNQRLLDLLAESRTDYLTDAADQPLDLPAVVTDAMSFTSHRLVTHGIDIAFAGQSEHTVRGDRVRLSQVLVNLINNACDAIIDQPEKWIRIDIVDRAGQAVIAVTNSGEKLDGSLSEQVFDPFFSTHADTGGTGLGLSICRNHIQAMGGELLLNPDSEHTRFDVVLPWAAGATSSDPANG